MSWSRPERRSSMHIQRTSENDRIGVESRRRSCRATSSDPRRQRRRRRRRRDVFRFESRLQRTKGTAKTKPFSLDCTPKRGEEPDTTDFWLDDIRLLLLHLSLDTELDVRLDIKLRHLGLELELRLLLLDQRLDVLLVLEFRLGEKCRWPSQPNRIAEIRRSDASSTKIRSEGKLTSVDPYQ
jgi:hypothetical protein